MEFLNIIIDQYNIPLLTAFILGVMTSIFLISGIYYLQYLVKYLINLL